MRMIILIFCLTATVSSFAVDMGKLRDRSTFSHDLLQENNGNTVFNNCLDGKLENCLNQAQCSTGEQHTLILQCAIASPNLIIDAQDLLLLIGFYKGYAPFENCLDREIENCMQSVCSIDGQNQIILKCASDLGAEGYDNIVNI